MNFKILTLLFLITSCGVEGPPTSPPGTGPGPITDYYKHDQKVLTSKEINQKNQKEKEEEKKEKENNGQ